MNKVESWVEQRRIMGRTVSNHESNRPDHESNRVKTLVVQGRIMGLGGPNPESSSVESGSNKAESFKWSALIKTELNEKQKFVKLG